jgi:hypothetical protein
MVTVSIQKLTGARQTGKIMHQMVRQFSMDMAPYASMSLPEIYDKIKRLPFRHDPPGTEVVKRPYYTMRGIGAGGDCDDKCVALASWARLNSIPYRFIGTGRKKPGQKKRKILLSHVLCQLYINGGWLWADPTYGFNVLGYVKGGYDRIEIL